MESAFLQALRATTDLTDKAAIVAEFLFRDLPEEVKLVARRCIILHWFDRFIVEALLQDTVFAQSSHEEIYAQIASLPCIETVPFGLAYQDVTREGLLKRYALTQPDVLQTAAHLAAPAYEVQEDERMAAEAMFCFIIAGDQPSSLRLLDTLLTRASRREDWYAMDNLLQLQDEAESLSFVIPLPRAEQSWLLRGLVHSTQNRLEEAIRDYSQALAVNTKNAVAYLSRGTTYVEQQEWAYAEADFTTALRLTPTLVQAYINRGMLYTRQKRYKDASKDF
ncbi:MAG: tetratricopeptide repeat protein, partial [Ktedonobacteraceae bacterium]